jgi:hypothetical protein
MPTVNTKTPPKARALSEPPKGQLESILAELQVIRLRLDYLIEQINGFGPGSVQWPAAKKHGAPAMLLAADFLLVRSHTGFQNPIGSVV